MKKRKLKLKNFIVVIIMFICILGLGVSSYQIIKWHLDSINTNKQIASLEEKAAIINITNNEKVEIVDQSQDIPEANPYWDYIKMDLINVNFDELKKINKDVKGWIMVNGTNINYPFVQTKNNEYYLYRSFDKNHNASGWVFIDYRNNMETLDKNTIIYAHGRVDRTMFGSLKNILTNDWTSNSNNFVIKISTEKENTLWQVFSIYRIPTTNDYLKVNFNNDEEYQSFLDLLLNRSQFNFNTLVEASDKIVTLSTCYNRFDKVVMHAKLIKKELK